MMTSALVAAVVLGVARAQTYYYDDTFVDDDTLGFGCRHAPFELLAESPESFGIGIGSGEKYYSDGDDYCWYIDGGESVTAITIVFDKFHTEAYHDYLYIRDATTDDDDYFVVAPLSGELPSPYIVRVESNKVLLHFQADDEYHDNPQTLQLGFEAHFFDSSDGSCASGCFESDGHGDCLDGLCDCVEEWGPDFTSDCSIATRVLQPDETVVVQNLEIGEWAYFKVVTTETVTALVELLDWGGVDSDPRLLFALDTVPTLSYYYYSDWFSWYYDCSDVHWLRGSIPAGTYYVGVTNDAFRAEEPLFANLTFRTEPGDEIPCLLDCNGHGICDTTTGDCVCDEGWAGSAVNAPQSCRFEIIDVDAFGTSFDGSVRIGDWDYYKLPEITDVSSSDERSIAVDFTSFSPHSYPVAFVKKDEPPKLKEGLLPTYDAFDFDFGDRDGFELVQGQRMSIVVKASKLELGTYYVGVYNLWGHNGAESYTSHDTCDYEIRFSEYSAGVPCPTTENGFCDGIDGACDFNTGICTCPPDRLWRDCSFTATVLDLADSTPLTGQTLDVDDYAYYLIAVEKKDVREQKNLLVTVSVTGGDGVPTVLAKFGDLPFATDLSSYDDHDLLSNYYGDAVHQILLDAQELADKGEGQWYVSVLNPEESKETITYSVSILFTDDLDCPAHHNNIDGAYPECSGDGVCVRKLGRCDCDDSYVLDDCSADGVFPVPPGSYFPTTYDGDAFVAPPVAPDDWIYFSVTVGCEARSLFIYFTTSNEGARPLLVVRKGRLPLMVQGTYDYWDYYAEESHSLTQAVYVTSCDDPIAYACGGGSCCISPGYPGTYFATGTPKPGVYYVGIYNDISATETITEYFFYADLYDPSSSYDDDRAFYADDCSEDDCAPGFVGYGCTATCPGVAPSDVYSNTPTGDGEICGGRGTCSIVNDDDVVETSCECEEGMVGPLCDLECPVGHVPGSADDDDEYAIPEVCSGRGVCVAMATTDDAVVDDAVPPADDYYAYFDDFLTGSYEAVCVCDFGFGGQACLDECASCGSHGTCTFQEGVQHCKCDDGYVGDACEFECPGSPRDCSGNGECVVVHQYDGTAIEATCECETGYHGDDCSLTCPTRDGLECFGRGVCVTSEEETSTRCECFTDYTGYVCQWLANETDVGASSSKSSSKKKPDSGVSTSVSAGLAATAVCLLGLAVAAWLLAERRKREISRYERLVREVGAASSTIITSAGATSRSSSQGSYAAPDDAVRQLGETPLPEFGEMRDVADSVSPFHSERVDL